VAQSAAQSSQPAVSPLVAEFEKALIDVDKAAAEKLFTEGIESTSPLEFMDHVMVPAIEGIGSRWDEGKIALSQMFMATRISEQLVNTLPPPAPIREDQPKLALALYWDYHALGKTVVMSMLRVNGFDVIDYKRQDDEGLIKRANEDKLKVLCISVLMMPSALRLKNVLPKLNPDIKVLVGGAPFRFDPEMYKNIGAHAMGKSATEAVERVTELMAS
jgi:methanogenic corrinoid protein MtbC1